MTRLGRRTREEIGKGNPVTALRFQMRKTSGLSLENIEDSTAE